MHIGLEAQEEPVLQVEATCCRINPPLLRGGWSYSIRLTESVRPTHILKGNLPYSEPID